jgi:hypothetical protein
MWSSEEYSQDSDIQVPLLLQSRSPADRPSGEAGPSVVCKATTFLHQFSCSSRAAGAKSKAHWALACFFSTFEPIKLTPNPVMQRNSSESTLQAALTYPACTFAEQRMCSDVCHWCLAISAVTHIQPCPTASAPGLELLQIPAWPGESRGEATEAGSMSSTSGCGAIGGGSLASSLW